jgi:cysteine synthase B
MPSSIIPAIYEPAVHDEKLSIPTDEGWAVTERLLHEEGLAVGHSSGANMAGALQLAQRCAERKEKAVIVTLFPDRADRYFEPRRWERSFAWP